MLGESVGGPFSVKGVGGFVSVVDIKDALNLYIKFGCRIHFTSALQMMLSLGKSDPHVSYIALTLCLFHSNSHFLQLPWAV
jgi:hypothetical protein